MTLSDLLSEFNIVVDTPEGLKEFRSLILGLAVRGKLVEQDSNDEPASELLKKIEAEKKRLYEDDEISKPKYYPAVPEDDIPFEVPNNWVWARNGNLILFQNGYAFKSGRFQESGIGVIRIGDLQNGQVVEDSMKYISEDYASEMKDDYLIKKGDMLIAMSGATTGKLAVNNSSKTYLLNQRVGKIDPILVDQDYLYRYLNTKIEENLAKSSGSAIPNLSTKQIAELQIPLPPLAEQHRIVQKIESLFAEVDELEAKLNWQTKLDEKLQVVVNAEVHHAPDAEASKSAWNFIISNFETFYHSPEAIDNLKKNILNEAVRGRLVLQNPNDEPASELLKKIEARKKRLYDERKIRKPNKLPPVKEDEIPFEIPESWEWVKFNEISDFINGDRGKNYPNKNEYVDEGVAWINTGHIETDGTLTISNMNYITEEKFNLLRSGKIKKTDLVYCLRGATFGKTAFVTPYEKGAIASSLMIIRPSIAQMNSYIFYYLISPVGRKQLFRFDNGSAQPNLSATSVRKYQIPLPSLKEQHRIVQRIEELFAICDRFKAQLQQRQNVNEKLVKGLVGEVLENN